MTSRGLDLHFELQRVGSLIRRSLRFHTEKVVLVRHDNVFGFEGRSNQGFVSAFFWHAIGTKYILVGSHTLWYTTDFIGLEGFTAC